MSDTFLYTSPEDVRARPLIEALHYEYASRYGADFPDEAALFFGSATL